MEKKYIVRSGYVKSRYDGGMHLITCRQLIKLYGVNPSECHLLPIDKEIRGLDLDKFIYLGPRDDGNYELPKEIPA